MSFRIGRKNAQHSYPEPRQGAASSGSTGGPPGPTGPTGPSGGPPGPQGPTGPTGSGSGATGATGATGVGGGGLIATDSSTSGAVAITGVPINVHPDINYVAGAGEKLIVSGSYRFVKDTTPGGVTVIISVTGQAPAVVSENIEANGSATIPFSFLYNPAAGAVTVNVQASTAAVGASIGVRDGTTVIQRTSV